MRAMCLGIAAVVVSAAVTSGAGLRIEKKAGEFAETRYLSEEAREVVRKENLLRRVGEADYEIEADQTGWYELYVQATRWPTELFLDGQFLIYTAFASGVWEDRDKTHKVLNVYLTAGKHTLTFSRRWHPGLPYMRRFFLDPATDITGQVRVTPVKDYLAFRLGEEFPVRLEAGRAAEAVELLWSLTDAQNGDTVWREARPVPAGTGNHTEVVHIPTGREGIFDLKITDRDGRPVDRIIQCCVIDPRKPAYPSELTKERLYTIDCVQTAPDYQQGDTRVVKGTSGAYRESGDRGREQGTAAADWFAYTLNLPTIQEPYLLEIEYPDDDERTVPIVLVEQEYGPPEPALGYFSGGIYPLSNQMLTQEFYFFPRVRDPRLLFYNWCTGQRAAVGKISVNKITSGLPCLKHGPRGRVYGMYQEEPLRHLCNFGAMPEGDKWLNIYRPTVRAAQLMSYVGTNLWNPTIAVYQSMLWPGESIPGYQVGILPPGPATLKEPLKKDVLRLMLLTCEKHGLNLVGDLHIPANNVLMRTLDRRFGGKGTLDDDGYHKPWLAVSTKGEVGLKSPYKPYYNALHPGVQAWAGDVIREIAERYRDCPSFKGVSIRFMGWTFAGWQCLPSIAWGYGDYSIQLFEQETGAKVPVDEGDPKRFRKRHEYLMQNQYQQWVTWRNRRMYAYHARLAEILTQTRPDLKLYLFLCGADFGHTATPRDLERKGWDGVLKETSLDLTLYRQNPAIVPYAGRGFPDGGNRGQGPLKNAISRDRSASLAPLQATSLPDQGGTVSALYLGTNHEGGYVKFEKLGYPKKNIRGNKQTIYPDATVYPAGIHYLERFANAMADANITWLSEGSHGYSIGQPQYLRGFLAEYRALPATGMKPLGKTDPAALWYGQHDGRTCFYVVNRTRYAPVSASVSFKQNPVLRRLATGETVSTDNGVLELTLAPYQLIAFDSNAVPQELDASIPQKDRADVQKMLESATTLVNSQPPEPTILAISPVEFQKARRKLNQARELVRVGSCWKAKQALVHLDLIRLYEALNTYPTGLFHRKSAPKPEGAMLPAELYQRVPSTRKVRVADGAEITPSLSNQSVLVWEGESLNLKLTVPHSGKYRIWYAYPVAPSYGSPVLMIDGKPEQDPLPAHQAAPWAKRVTKPVALDAGEHEITLKQTSKRAGLFYLCFEPLFRDLGPEHFAAIGPFAEIANVRKTDRVYQRLDEALPPEHPVDLSAAYAGADGRKVRWVTPVSDASLTGPFGKGYVDLYTTFGVMSHVVCCAVTRIDSPEERKALISFGSDYWAKVTLNDEEVFRPEGRPRAAPAKGEVTIPIALRKGENVLFIKNHAGSAGNGFWLSITDPGDLELNSGMPKGPAR